LRAVQEHDMKRAMTSSAIRQVRVIGIVEGISFLLLLGVAMPLKYLVGLALAVRVVGLAHGVLFLLYLALAVQAFFVARWPMPRLLGVLAAAVFPFGPFLIERRLRREQADAERAEAAATSPQPPPAPVPG
jgi:integral membrane protein